MTHFADWLPVLSFTLGDGDGDILRSGSPTTAVADLSVDRITGDADEVLDILQSQVDLRTSGSFFIYIVGEEGNERDEEEGGEKFQLAASSKRWRTNSGGWLDSNTPARGPEFLPMKDR